MQTRSSDENYVRPSVCPSGKRVDCDKTEERPVHIYMPYKRSFSVVFRGEEWLVGCDPSYQKFWVNRPPLERNRTLQRGLFAIAEHLVVFVDIQYRTLGVMCCSIDVERVAVLFARRRLRLPRLQLHQSPSGFSTILVLVHKSKTPPVAKWVQHDPCSRAQIYDETSFGFSRDRSTSTIKPRLQMR